MKREIIDSISRCLEFQKVKVKLQYLAGLFQPLPILEWKWEIISMDFITQLPKTRRQHYAIMVMVDKLSKFAHFIPIKSTFKGINILIYS